MEPEDAPLPAPTDDGPATPETPPGPEQGNDPAAELRAALAEREAELAAQHEANRALLERLRTALLESDPSVAPELVRATSLEELESSFAAARAVVARVRQSVLREVATSVPAGAPARGMALPASPIEKIRAGLRSA